MWSMLSVYIDMPGIGLTAFAPVTPARARCFQPAAAWACGKDANRRRASQKKCCISGEATAGQIAWVSDAPTDVIGPLSASSAPPHARIAPWVAAAAKPVSGCGQPALGSRSVI